jgi:ABC-type lipoprotein release transport system permease subunit
MSFDAIVDLRDDLDAMLQRIRTERHIHPAAFRCLQAIIALIASYVPASRAAALDPNSTLRDE